MEYTVEVHTGDVRGGGSDANVFLTLGGANGSSPKTHLKVFSSPMELTFTMNCWLCYVQQLSLHNLSVCCSETAASSHGPRDHYSIRFRLLLFIVFHLAVDPHLSKHNGTSSVKCLGRPVNGDPHMMLTL